MRGFKGQFVLVGSALLTLVYWLCWPSQEIETEPRNGEKRVVGRPTGLEMKRKYFEMTDWDCLLLGIGTLFRSLDNKL